MKDFLKFYLLRLFITCLIVIVWALFIYIGYIYFDVIGVIIGFVLIVLSYLLYCNYAKDK